MDRLLDRLAVGAEVVSAVHVSSESKQVQITPGSFVAQVADRFGVEFVLDLAATQETARQAVFISEAEDSLSQDWKARLEASNDRTVDLKKVCSWLNPPFRGVGPWMEKCGAESKKGMKIISLTLASLGTGWYRDHVEGKAMSFILRDRITFEGEKDPFPKELMISLWGFSMTGLGFWSWKEKA